MTVEGRWRVVETEVWDQEALDLVAPAFIEFGDDGTGRIGFIAVDGWIDWRSAEREGRPAVEFSWEGSDDGAPVNGRGWAVLDAEDSLRGRIYFHLGDDSGFRAVRAQHE